MSKNPLSFREGPARDALLAWWRALQDAPGDRAELRRCRSVSSVFFCPAFHALRLALMPHASLRDDRLAIAAAVLAHVKTTVPAPPARQMAQAQSNGDSAPISGLRFRRLIKIGNDEPDALLRAMQRIVHALGDAANISELAHALYWWNDAVRRQWATDYYTTAPQEP